MFISISDARAMVFQPPTDDLMRGRPVGYLHSSPIDMRTIEGRRARAHKRILAQGDTPLRRLLVEEMKKDEFYGDERRRRKTTQNDTNERMGE
jgi:hypothetical protein